MLKRFFIILLLGLVALPALGAGGLVTDEVSVQYPQGYTKLLVADLAKLVGQEELRAGLFDPLAAAHHPLTGIYSILAMLQLDPTAAEYVAYGTGHEVSPLALVRGLDPGAVMGALMGVQYAVGAPGSPFTDWEMETIHGLPVVFIGGAFGPLQIQWAYIATEHTLWIGTEVAFGGEPDVARLRATTELVIERMRGRVAPFPELPIAVAVRGGDLAFVRVSDPAVDRPLESGEQAMGYYVSFTDNGAEIHFALRFSSVAEAAAAGKKIAGGGSGYLAQDLYRGELVSLSRVNRDLYFDVAAGLPGIIGLLMLTIPM
ncbi:MAG: hypothetical protein ACE5LQ_02030 [Candidatus Bipolaricaulia bacterium]